MIALGYRAYPANNLGCTLFYASSGDTIYCRLPKNVSGYIQITYGATIRYKNTGTTSSEIWTHFVGATGNMTALEFDPLDPGGSNNVLVWGNSATDLTATDDVVNVGLTKWYQVDKATGSVENQFHIKIGTNQQVFLLRWLLGFLMFKSLSILIQLHLFLVMVVNLYKINYARIFCCCY